MIASLKRILKWGSPQTPKNQVLSKNLLLMCIFGILEDVLFWKTMWWSIGFIVLLNIVFFICVQQQISLFPFIFFFCAIVVSINAIEEWLKHKHRTTFLKQLSSRDGSKLLSQLTLIFNWLKQKGTEFIYLRETNHTKAFLLVNIILGALLLVGKFVNGYLLTYLVCMLISFIHKIYAPVVGVWKKVQQNVDSDSELEGLIPEVTDTDIKLLNFEAEQNIVIDERQSLDYWKPEDLPLGEISDESSEHSSSILTNLSPEKMHTLDRDVETSDSSDDEYTPLDKKEQLQSTLEIEAPDTWGNSAYNAFRNLTGAVSNMVYTTRDTKRTRVSSVDSSDGFEIIDKRDVM